MYCTVCTLSLSSWSKPRLERLKTAGGISSRDKNGADSIQVSTENVHISIAQLTYSTSKYAVLLELIL